MHGADGLHTTGSTRAPEPQHANEAQAVDLRARIEALQKREYRAPVMPMACKEEREAALLCYQRTRGAAAGEVAFACQQAADDLERCASLVREAAMVKIAAGSLQQ